MLQDPFQQKALDELQKAAEIIRNVGFKVSVVDKKVYNYEVIINNGSDKIKLLVYFGKKGLKTVFQGNEKSEFYNDIKQIIFGADLFESSIERNNNFIEYVGTDESGKGDYFGPLVVAAVYVDQNTIKRLENLGVKDSKLSSDHYIKLIEPDIKKVIDHKFNIVIINPEKYNLLYNSFRNLNKILGWAHSKAIENLLTKKKCENIISDKFGDEKLIRYELLKKYIELNLYQTPKAERYTGVAAASILARAKVIDWFNQQSKVLKLNIPKGAGTEVNKVAKSVFDQYGAEYLQKMIKFHFKNSKQLF
jgi:ribonuclease HIII